MKYLVILVSLLAGCGSASVPIDSATPWDVAGRFAAEMKVDCNATTHSIGISGCAFKRSELGGNLILPSLWGGTVGFTSYNCKNLSVAATNNADNVLQLRDLYTAQNQRSCSFELVRTIREGDFVSDNTLTGRFFIKILPDYGYSKLKFSIGNDTFEGVGWFQRKYQGSDAVMLVKPKSKSGIFTITCGNEALTSRIVYRTVYSTSPFEVKLNSNEKCDYEMIAVGDEPTGDGSDVESATYIHHVIPQLTKDISVPAVTRKSNKITFSFNDTDSSGKKKVVYAVQVGGSKFIKSNSGTVVNNKEIYVVKGLTSAMRLFYGEYNKTTNTWVLK